MPGLVFNAESVQLTKQVYFGGTPVFWWHILNFHSLLSFLIVAFFKQGIDTDECLANEQWMNGTHKKNRCKETVTGLVPIVAFF